MTAKRERRIFRNLEQAQRDLSAIQSLWPDVCLRDDEPVVRDGFSASSRGDSGRSVGSHGDSTGERAAADIVRDYVHADVSRLARNLDAIVKGLGDALVTATHLTRHPKVEREQSVPDCLACGELALPRPRAGYCEPCYRAWTRAGRPDRLRFERERKSVSPPDDEIAESVSPPT